MNLSYFRETSYSQADRELVLYSIKKFTDLLEAFKKNTIPSFANGTQKGKYSHLARYLMMHLLNDFFNDYVYEAY